MVKIRSFAFLEPLPVSLAQVRAAGGLPIPEFLERVGFDQGRGRDHHGFILERRRMCRTEKFCQDRPQSVTKNLEASLSSVRIRKEG